MTVITECDTTCVTFMYCSEKSVFVTMRSYNIVAGHGGIESLISRNIGGLDRH